VVHWRWLCVPLLIATAGRAATYPVSANLVLAPQSAQRCLSLPQESDCRVVQFARDAFALAVARMFTPSAPGNLQLEMSIKSADIVGVELELLVRVRVLAPDGRFVQELTAFGSAPALERDPDTLARAEQVAAEAAARDFEGVYARARDVGEYLISNKAATAEAVRVPARGDRLITLAAGIGMMQGGGDDDFALAATLRIAASYRWGSLQLFYSHYSSTFIGGQTLGAPQPLGADLATNDIGLEAGAVFRLTPSWEVRAGPGVHFLFGDASFKEDTPTLPSSFTSFAPTLYGSVARSFLATRTGPYLSIGIETRGYFFTSVDLPQLLRKVPVANFSAVLFVALELPWGAEPENAR